MIDSTMHAIERQEQQRADAAGELVPVLSASMRPARKSLDLSTSPGIWVSW